ncbi:MAG: MBL fold metallo-hydrolase [Leucobacter sp.]
MSNDFQVLGLCRTQVGDATVTALTDCVVPFDQEILILPDGADASSSEYRTSGHVSINAFLVQTGAHTVLIDSGFGHEGKGSTGELLEKLAEVGVASGDITAVLLTHLHVDHVAGIVDDCGRPQFPNAQLVLHSEEYGFWIDGAEQVPDSQLNHREAALRVTAYGDRLSLRSGGEVVPGIEMLPLPGHTPGHSGYLIGHGDERLVIWGDIIHQPTLQFANPDIRVVFDVNADEAERTRVALFERVIAEGLRVAGLHFDQPAFGRLSRTGEGRYLFHPER